MEAESDFELEGALLAGALDELAATLEEVKLAATDELASENHTLLPASCPTATLCVA